MFLIIWSIFSKLKLSLLLFVLLILIFYIADDEISHSDHIDVEMIDLVYSRSNLPVCQGHGSDISELEVNSQPCVNFVSHLWTHVQPTDVHEIQASEISNKDIESHHGIQPTSKQKYQNKWKFDPLKVMVQ